MKKIRLIKKAPNYFFYNSWIDANLMAEVILSFKDENHILLFSVSNEVRDIENKKEREGFKYGTAEAFWRKEHIYAEDFRYLVVEEKIKNVLFSAKYNSSTSKDIDEENEKNILLENFYKNKFKKMDKDLLDQIAEFIWINWINDFDPKMRRFINDRTKFINNNLVSKVEFIDHLIGDYDEDIIGSKTWFEIREIKSEYIKGQQSWIEVENKNEIIKFVKSAFFTCVIMPKDANDFSEYSYSIYSSEHNVATLHVTERDNSNFISDVLPRIKNILKDRLDEVE